MMKKLNKAIANFMIIISIINIIIIYLDLLETFTGISELVKCLKIFMIYFNVMIIILAIYGMITNKAKSLKLINASMIPCAIINCQPLIIILALCLRIFNKKADNIEKSKLKEIIYAIMIVTTVLIIGFIIYCIGFAGTDFFEGHYYNLDELI